MTARHGFQADKAPDGRRVRMEVVVSVLVIILIVVAFVYILIDLRRSGQNIDNSKNSVATSRIESTDLEYETYTQSTYVVDLPVGWKKINSPEIIIDGQRYYPDRFQGVEDSQVGRRLDVYLNSLPGLLPVTKLLEVNVMENEIIPKTISTSCLNFTDVPEGGEASQYPSEWQNHKFICRPSGSANTVAAVNNDLGDGIVLNNENTSGRFLIIWQDHGSQEDNSIFFKLLETFKLR